jgi:hypothetical protein
VFRQTASRPAAIAAFSSYDPLRGVVSGASELFDRFGLVLSVSANQRAPIARGTKVTRTFCGVYRLRFIVSSVSSSPRA